MYRHDRRRCAAFTDQFDDYLAFLEPRLREAHRLLASNGTFYLHVDYREVHYLKVLLDQIFGRDCFLNEVAITTLEWSPYCPDINPIENIWSILKRKVLKS